MRKGYSSPGYFLTFANLAGAGASFFASWVIAQTLVPSDFASIQFALNYYGIFLMFSLLGLNDGGFKYALEASSDTQRRDRLRAVFGTTFLSSLFLAAVFVLLTGFGFVSQHSDVKILLALMCGCIPIANLGYATQTAFRNENQIRRLGLHQGMIRLSYAIAVIAGAKLGGQWGVAWGFVVSQMMALLISIGLLSKDLRRKWRFEWRLIHASSLPFLWAALVTINARVDLIVMEKMVGPTAAAGGYALASVFALSFLSLGWSLQGRTSAVLLKTQSSPVERRQQILKLQLQISLAALVWTALILIFIYYFFPLVFGSKYESIKIYLLPLLIYCNISTASNAFYYTLFVLGYAYYNVGVLLLGVSINVVLTSIFLSHYGITAVPYGKLIAEIFVFLLSLIFFKLNDRKAAASGDHRSEKAAINAKIQH